jgi:hypothetical protein
MFCPFSLAPWFLVPPPFSLLVILHVDPVRTAAQRTLDKDDLWGKSSCSPEFHREIYVGGTAERSKEKVRTILLLRPVTSDTATQKQTARVFQFCLSL